MTSHDSAARGVAEAWDHWLGQHPVSVPEMIEEAIREAATTWLDTHGEDLFRAAIKEALKDKTPGGVEVDWQAEAEALTDQLGDIRASLAAAEAALDDARAHTRPATHPEPCRRCGGENITWSAPSPLWNAVMRGGSVVGPEQYGDLVCPICFAQLAEEQGIAKVWRLDAARVLVPLETVTPSGRVWNPQTWLWEPPTSAEDASHG